MIMNYKTYNAQMVKSAYDKLFFVDKVFDIDTIVDFGCADGAITEMIKMFYPDAAVIGYDLYQRNKSTEDITYTQSLNVVKKLIKGKKALLVMNSVVHEIYNYEEEPFELLEDLFSLGFEYIWIRDLNIYDFTFGKSTDYLKVANIIREKYTEQVRDFEEQYGAVAYPNNLLHFLLKFRYVENWKREVKEDYTLFARYTSKMERILEKNYTTEYREEYVLPHTRKVNMDEFGIDLQMNCKTHYKGLFKKK